MFKFKILILFILYIVVITPVFSQEKSKNTIRKEQQPNSLVSYPVITKSIELKFLDEDNEKVKLFLDGRKDFIKALIQQLEKEKTNSFIQLANLGGQIEKDEKGVALDNINNSDIAFNKNELKLKQEKISDLISNLKDINFKHVNLRQLLDMEVEAWTSVSISPPFTYETISKINGSIEELSSKEPLLTKELESNKKRLEKLENLLNDYVVQYTQQVLSKKQPLEIFNLIRNIYLYQAEYTLLYVKNKRLQLEINHVSEQLDKSSSLLTQAFKNINVSNKDIETLELKLKQQEKEHESLLVEHLNLNRNFNKSSFKAELELSNFEQKIINETNQQKIDVLNTQKQVNLTNLKYYYTIKNLLHQKEVASQLSKDSLGMQLVWLRAYKNKDKKRNTFKSVINDWSEKLAKLQDIKSENNQLLDSLSRSALDISNSQQAMKVKSNKPGKILSQERLLNKQLVKSMKTIQRLSAQLNNNNLSIEAYSHKSMRIINLLSLEINKIDKIGKWFGDKFESQYHRIKNILYYPIASFGERPFTLAIILKVLLTIILGFLFLRIFRKWFAKILNKRAKLSEGASHSISTLIYYLGVMLVSLGALSSAGFNLGQMMLVFGALGVGIGFGLQNIANNFVSGMILLIDRTLTVGDSVTLSDGTHGKVSKLAMRYTVIRTNGGYDIIVPNSELISNRVTSMTFDDNYFRIEIPFGVSYDADPELVKEITLEVANNVKHTINRESQKSAVLFSGFGDNSLDFVLRVWVFIYDRYRPYAIKSDYYYKLFKAFKDAGIEIPYPQRDFHIRSVDKDVLYDLQRQNSPNKE